MKKNPVLYLVTALILGLSLLVFSCQAAPSTEPTTPAVEEPAVEEPAVEEPAQTTGGVTAISHPLAGRDNCLMCHETGVGGADVIPEDHVGRANETCTACHQPAE